MGRRKKGLPPPAKGVRITPNTLQWKVDLGVNDYRRKQTKKGELKSPCLSSLQLDSPSIIIFSIFDIP